MEIKITSAYKSLLPSPAFILNDFAVLTGKNGTGKTHFLEALLNTNHSLITENGQKLSMIKYIPFNGLNPNVEAQCDFDSIRNHVKNLWNQVNNLQRAYKNKGRGADQKKWFTANLGDPNIQRQFCSVLNRSSMNPEDITEDTIRKYLNYSEITQGDMFVGQFATVFKAYHTRSEDNKYTAYKNATYQEKNEVLTDDQFKKLYGPPPWDLVNEILSNAKLPYRVNDPTKQSKESSFMLSLSDAKRKIEIQVNDLSTGEKVLMSLALAIYNSTESGAKTDLLLLDEPDAALHPEFSKLLVESLKTYIVEKANVKVIISTHSPTTVAASDEGHIYEMRKGLSIPLPTSKSRAIAILSEGIDNLRISTEKRRQVFVESHYDVVYYEKIYNLLNITTSTLPQFLAPHSRLGSNCTDVIEIVKKLSSLGNDLVYGIIDSDNSNKEEGRILILGVDKRYSIENYILDPIYIGLLLIRENIIEPSYFGITEIKTFVTCKNLLKNDIQLIINRIEEDLSLTSGKEIDCKCINGITVKENELLLKMKGHDLEEKIIQKWPQLNIIKRGKTEDNIIKNYIIRYIITEYPEFLDIDFINLFDKII